LYIQEPKPLDEVDHFLGDEPLWLEDWTEVAFLDPLPKRVLRDPSKSLSNLVRRPE
jgi:hypothetical protein